MSARSSRGFTQRPKRCQAAQPACNLVPTGEQVTMMTVNRILMPVDFSEHSARALAVSGLDCALTAAAPSRVPSLP
jgi:hypothetical protein